MKFLYQMSLDILYLYGTFSGMAKKYVAYHLGGFSDLELDAAKDSKERIEGKNIQWYILLWFFRLNL